MQQLYLTGRHASALAEQIFTALNIHPAGYRLQPFSIDGSVRGEALRLLLPPAEPLLNAVPCRIRVSAQEWVTVYPALERLAVPCLTSAALVHAPLLLDGLTADLLSCDAFCTVVRQCLTAQRPVIAVVREEAESILRTLTPPDRQQWVSVPYDADERAVLLEHLIAEAAMRF